MSGFDFLNLLPTLCFTPEFSSTLITVFVWINYMGQHPKTNNLSVRSNLCEHISISQKVVHCDLSLSLFDLSYDYFIVFVYRSQIWSDIWYMTWWDIYIAVYKILSLDVVHWFTFVRLLHWVHFSDNNWSADIVYTILGINEEIMSSNENFIRRPF